MPVVNSNRITIRNIEKNDVKENTHTQNKATMIPVKSFAIHANEIHIVHNDHNTHTSHNHDGNAIEVKTNPIMRYGPIGPAHIHEETHHDHVNLPPKHELGFMGHDEPINYGNEGHLI